MNEKHAYLIMVHKNSYTLEILLKQLDNIHNDIYIHVDKKCKNFHWNEYRKIVTHSQMLLVEPRQNVHWGGYSLVQSEITLLEYAYNQDQYIYYHLLSGQDLCLKSQKEIADFFQRNKGKVFVNSNDVSKDSNWNFNFSNRPYGRVSVKRIFTEISCKNRVLRKSIRFIDRACALFQAAVLKKDYVAEKGICLAYGSNWFSIPANIAKLILDNKSKIDHYFKDAIVADELFLQSILKEYDVDFLDDNLRLIDWNRGKDAHPYVWQNHDINLLINSDKLFARKFDESIDRKIIDAIWNYTRNQSTKID